MSDFITLTCPSCGGKLKVTDQIHLLACRNCGNEHMVVRNSDSIYLAPLAQDVRGIRVGVDKTAAELAVARLRQEVAALTVEIEAVKNRVTNDWIQPSFVEKVLPFTMLIGVFFMCGGLSRSGGAMVPGLIFIGSLIGYLVLNHNRTKKIREIKNAELDRLQHLYNDRIAALTKNRRIAES